MAVTADNNLKVDAMGSSTLTGADRDMPVMPVILQVAGVLAFLQLELFRGYSASPPLTFSKQ